MRHRRLKIALCKMFWTRPLFWQKRSRLIARSVWEESISCLPAVPSETTELLFDLLAYIRYNLYHTSETQFCNDMVVRSNTWNCYFIYLSPPEKVGVITSLVLIFNFSSRKFPRLASWDLLPFLLSLEESNQDRNILKHNCIFPNRKHCQRHNRPTTKELCAFSKITVWTIAPS